MTGRTRRASQADTVLAHAGGGGFTMSTTIGALGGGDESGAETFSRYRYQSKITLLYWLQTLVPDGPIAVYAEHIEDVVCEYRDRQELIQVKSRSEDRHLWRASEMCGENGGVDSLARAYGIAKDLNCSFELHLEGGSSPSDETKTFVAKCADASAALRTKVTAHLKAVGQTKAALGPFLERLRICPKLPAQRVAHSVCLEALVHIAPTLTGGELIELCEKLLQIVEHAQEAEHSGLAPDASPEEFLEARLASVLHLRSEDPDTSLAEAKRLTADRLVALLPASPTAEGLLLLKRTTTDSGTSALERKLVNAGANPAVIESAKSLRAMSETRRIELLSGPDHLVERLEDLDARVLTHARAVALGHVDSATSANGIWHDLVVQDGLETVDHFDLFQHDRQALVGLLCCISDECRFGWTAS